MYVKGFERKLGELGDRVGELADRVGERFGRKLGDRARKADQVDPPIDGRFRGREAAYRKVERRLEGRFGGY